MDSHQNYFRAKLRMVQLDGGNIDVLLQTGHMDMDWNQTGATNPYDNIDVLDKNSWCNSACYSSML